MSNTASTLAIVVKSTASARNLPGQMLYTMGERVGRRSERRVEIAEKRAATYRLPDPNMMSREYVFGSRFIESHRSGLNWSGSG